MRKLHQITDGKAMRALKLLAVATAALSIAGCKTSVEAEVSMSDLMGGATKSLPASLYVEVAGCSDHEDSRKPSSSLLQVQSMVPDIFAGAEYVECFRKRFDSFARFNIPITLDRDKDGKPASETQINLVANDQALLALSIPDAITKKMEATQRNLAAPSFDMSVSIKVINDTHKDVRFRVLAAYIDDKPFVYGDLTSHADGSFMVTLSDVSVRAALSQSVAPILIP